MTKALSSTSGTTPETYLEVEKQTSTKHEFVNGSIYAMGGASDKHGLINLNLASALSTSLPDSCEVFVSDMKLHIQQNDDRCYYYPDILVSCDSSDDNPYYREKPLLIVEVISPSTERIDRTEKRERYQKIPELLEYVLVAQDFPKVEVYRRNQAWRGEEYFIEDSFRLESVDLEFSVLDIYRRIKY